MAHLNKNLIRRLGFVFYLLLFCYSGRANLLVTSSGPEPASVVEAAPSAGAASNFADKPKEIIIGLTPGTDPALLRAQSLEFAKALQSEIEIPINIYISKTYGGLVEAMKNKKVDFGFFSSLTYVYAEKEADAKVLLKKVWTEPYYFSALVVRSESKIKKVTDLKGKKIAFVDNKSASGYLYPNVMFKKSKIKTEDFLDVQYSGNHAASLELLASGKVDAIATFADDSEGKTGGWTKFAQKAEDREKAEQKPTKEARQKYRVIWVSEPIPNDPFCVRGDFYEKYPKVTHSLMFSLIDLFEKNNGGKKFGEIIGSQTMVPATTRQYEPVREMVKLLGLDFK